MPNDTKPDAAEGSADTANLAAEVEKWKALAKKHEDRAKANADKARRLDELEESSKSDKSEMQQLNDRLAAFEQRAQKAEQSALRLRVATDFRIGSEDADLFLTGSDEETLRAQAKRLAEHADEKRRNGAHVKGEGKQPDRSGSDDPMRDFVRRAFADAG